MRCWTGNGGVGADHTHYSTDTSGCLMLSIIAIAPGHDTTDTRTSPIHVR